VTTCRSIFQRFISIRSSIFTDKKMITARIAAATTSYTPRSFGQERSHDHLSHCLTLNCVLPHFQQKLSLTYVCGLNPRISSTKMLKILYFILFVAVRKSQKKTLIDSSSTAFSANDRLGRLICSQSPEVAIKTRR
jgi:hypothetical protein